jgi:3-deoxy-D-manno-octulosonic-acid transferase
VFSWFPAREARNYQSNCENIFQDSMMGLLLDAIYLLSLVASAPLWVYRMIRHGRYRSGWSERLGGVPIRYGLQPIIWIHGVSLGEINAARTLVEEIHAQLPDFRVVISSTTDTGIAAARRLFAPDHKVFHWPMDFTLAVRRALKRMRPELIVLIEGEVWPNFLAACKRLNIPAVVVNARISATKGYPRYRLLGPLAGKLFNRLSAIGVQDDIYAERLRSLGVDDERIHLTGMMKFDTAQITDSAEGASTLAESLGIATDQSLIVAGGTGPGEEKMILDLWGSLKQEHPRARLAIVPRKPERFDEVAGLISAAGFALVRRSESPDGSKGDVSGDTIMLGDTMGELRKFYSLATCVFVGRSLVPMGGSDMIEAAALGKPTAYGPHTFNFPQADPLVEHGCVRISDPAALMRQFDEWLSDPAAAERTGREAQQYVRSQQGATKRNVEMICQILNRTPAVTDGAIATEAIRG